MKILRFTFAAVVLTVMTYAAEWFWGIDPVLRTLGKVPRMEITASDIRALGGYYIVDPHWLGGDAPVQFLRWARAEWQARLAVVLLLWSAGMVGAFWWASRETTAINSVQPTRASARG